MPKTRQHNTLRMSIMLYNHIVQVLSLRKTSERLSSLIKETMYQFEIGFKSTVQAKGDIEKEKDNNSRIYCS